MMKITPKVALEIAFSEGLVRQAYKDSVGVWTWSIGITNATGHKVERYIDNPQPMRRCIEVYLWALERYAEDVRRAFAGFDLTEAQFAAALKFHYNTGAIGRASWVKKWKAGDVSGARKRFMDWRKPPEIIPRRRAERDLFFDGKWSGDGTVMEYTEVTANHIPKWSSARRVDISSDVLAILGAETPTHAPKSSPEPTTPDNTKNPAGALAAAFMALVRLILSMLPKGK